MKIIIIEDSQKRKNAVAEIVSNALRDFGVKINMGDGTEPWKPGLSEELQDYVVESLQTKYITIEVLKIDLVK